MAKQRHLYLTLFLLLGTSSCFPNYPLTQTSISQPITNECPPEPQDTLPPSAVKEIALTPETQTETGTLRPNQPLGYSFEGKAGEKVNYRTEDNICLWIYSPKNELLTGTELPLTGRYTVQVSVPQGTKTFSLQMSLGDSPPVIPEAVQTVSSQPFQKADPFPLEDFPQSSCGDSKPSDPNAYPVNFYPVNIPYSERDLEKAQIYFCEDAYQKRDKGTREKVIQIASFISEEKARRFADLVNTKMSGANVGEPTTIYE